jgi:alkylation response protein AidB-like acyl-CoA dehydrogenase
VRLPIGPGTPMEEAIDAVRSWVADAVPATWREAASGGGREAIRHVRSYADYVAWYPAFAESGLVVPTWPVAYGGLELAPVTARRIEQELGPLNLGHLNPLGLNLCAPALFAHGTQDQRLRYLPQIVANRETWCQLFSEPGAGSDLASLATRAERNADEWVLTGQKVWTTWAHVADWGVCLARTNADVPKRKGITYFLVDMHAVGIDVRPLRHIGGEAEFNEVFLDAVRVPDTQRVGDEGRGWEVASATLSGERQMISGSGSGGVDRIGGSDTDALVGLARRTEMWMDPVVRQRVVGLWAQERIRRWTNARVRAAAGAGRSLGPESSIGKVHQGELNQRIQLAACDLLGPSATAWTGDLVSPEVKGMLRSRANTIEGGTAEVNKNVLGERVLGLPREPDPWRDTAWSEVPRS